MCMYSLLTCVYCALYNVVVIYKFTMSLTTRWLNIKILFRHSQIRIKAHQHVHLAS